MQKIQKTPLGKKPNPIDAHVGHRITLRRRLLKMSQSDLAEKIGITFQQVQKYEKGYNRIGASRLWEISNILGVSVDFFFIGLNIPDDNSKKQNKTSDPMLKEETFELVDNYYSIKNRAVAQNLLHLLQNLAGIH